MKLRREVIVFFLCQLLTPSPSMPNAIHYSFSFISLQFRYHRWHWSMKFSIVKSRMARLTNKKLALLSGSQEVSGYKQPAVPSHCSIFAIGLVSQRARHKLVHKSDKVYEYGALGRNKRNDDPLNIYNAPLSRFGSFSLSIRVNFIFRSISVE